MAKSVKLFGLLLAVSLAVVLGSCDLFGIGGDSGDSNDGLNGTTLTYLNLASHSFAATGYSSGYSISASVSNPMAIAYHIEIKNNTDEPVNIEFEYGSNNDPAPVWFCHQIAAGERLAQISIVRVNEYTTNDKAFIRRCDINSSGLPAVLSTEYGTSVNVTLHALFVFQ